MDFFNKKYIETAEAIFLNPRERYSWDKIVNGVRDGGGLAMSAYNYTQFNSISEAERNHIAQALLRYCELDTLAMVMLVQGLFELRQKPLNVVI